MFKHHVRKYSDQAFTIVELLVVIVVIGILASITIVSYTGITQRATATSLVSDLSSASQQLKLYQVIYGSYPASLDSSNCPTAPNIDINYCLKPTSGNTFLYSANINSTPQTFSLYVVNNSTKVKYYATNDSAPSLSPQVVATGGTITNVGGYRIHTFTTSGTFTVTSGDNVEYLVVAGGGGGGGINNVPGGGGAGGFRTGFLAVTAGAKTVTVGAGGAVNVNGADSVFDSVTATGGGKGGSESNNNAGIGGSGGGGTYTFVGGAGIIGQGNKGGDGGAPGTGYPAGGGGGAGGVGSNGINGTASGGAGGVGLASSISGTLTFYAGGGGGGAWSGTTIPSAGGNGGGGNGGSYNIDNATAGTANTGGGGGGGYTASVSKAGGSGIVIIRYPN